VPLDPAEQSSLGSPGALLDHREHPLEYLVHRIAPGVDDEVGVRPRIGEPLLLDTVQPLRPVVATTRSHGTQVGVEEDQQIWPRVAPEIADDRVFLTDRNRVDPSLAQAASDRRRT